MPAGLDGHPDPVVTPVRTAVLDAVAAAVVGARRGRTLIGVDGRPGAGKSTFADEVAGVLRQRGASVVRSTTDSFHRRREERLARGSASPDGYYLDSHRLDVIVDDLLRPFAEGAGTVRVAAFDEPSDTADDRFQDVPADAVLVFDGLFLHRPELAPSWDVSVLLVADRRLDAAWLAFLLDGLPDEPVAAATLLDERLHRARWPRYREGWRRYVEEHRPAEQASFVIDNDEVSSPEVVER